MLGLHLIEVILRQLVVRPQVVSVLGRACDLEHARVISPLFGHLDVAHGTVSLLSWLNCGVVLLTLYVSSIEETLPG